MWETWHCIHRRIEYKMYRTNRHADEQCKAIHDMTWFQSPVSSEWRGCVSLRSTIVIITAIFLLWLNKASWLILKGAGGIVNVLNMAAKTVTEQGKAVIINDLIHLFRRDVSLVWAIYRMTSCWYYISQSGKTGKSRKIQL